MMFSIMPIENVPNEAPKKRSEIDALEQRFRLLFDSSPDAIFVEDTDGYVLDVNTEACRLHGMTRDQLVGKHVLDLVPPEARDEVSREFPRLAKGELDGVEGFSFAADRGPIPVELRTRPIEYAGKAAILLHVRDISKRRQAEEALHRSEEQLRHAQRLEAVGTLASGLAHDFNNLMTVISCYSDLLLHGLEENTRLHQDTQEIRKASNSAADLTRQLLMFSRKQIVSPVLLDLNSLLAEMESLLLRLIGEDIEVVHNHDPDLRSVRVDRGQIEQVVMNLAINARDAMPRGGRLTIITSNVVLTEAECRLDPDAQPGNFVCLSTEDTGVGMDEETLDRVLEPYFTTKELGKGTGLGLSVVYGIVKKHEGSISISSTPGRGSLFRVYLPSVESAPRQPSKEQLNLEKPRGKGERILLVEDHSEIREISERILTENNYHVESAANAADAVELFEKEADAFDLLFSDMILADTTGLDLAERLRAINPELYVLLTSGYMDDKLQLRLIEEKGYPFLSKPYANMELLRTIRRELDKRAD